ncbi:hypothetical protein [Aerolutibacter ruishenii]|uniref:Uncharacterized protein n=1 Tax=Aerolutibacter ruishenii TaxID=686800 RepID=A0A562M3C8_9GAMM|nr:hypothetical protein [Lysobacter ruishenii]TWI14380.1 hypothetical protein IP93_00377 [Lysobacter ruishenii]
MPHADRLQQDLDYLSRTVRHRERPVGTPAIYFLWALIVLVGFALPDLAPRVAGAYWCVVGIGGGLLSWWLGARDARVTGVSDPELGKRYGYHWLIGGIGFLLAALPVALGRAPIESAVGTFMLVAGLSYAFAGLHLNRPILWSGLLMLAAYGVMVVAQPPYAWTFTGIAIAASLLWAGLSAQRQRRAGALQ